MDDPALVGTPPDSASPSTSGLQQEGQVVVLDVEEGHLQVDESHTTTDPDDFEGDDEAAETTVIARRKRRKNPSVIISEEDEKRLGEWLEDEAEFIYNKGLSAYKDKAKVTRAFEEKARTLDPPLTGEELKTWFTSLRSRFGRLTAEKSGQGARRRLTDREKWILNIFHFLRPHIVRQKQPKMLGLPQVSFFSNFYTIYIYIYKLSFF